MAKSKDIPPSTPPWMNAGAPPVQASGTSVTTSAVPDQNVVSTPAPDADSTPPSVQNEPTAAETDPAVVTPAPTQENTPSVPPVVAPVVVEPVAITPPVEVASELVDTVTVTVPKAFKLRVDNFRELEIKAGIQEMERQHADHWYSVANGVQVYKAK